MFNPIAYTGAEMPDKTLCLTYDDGPGVYTSAIAEFLHTQGVQATFFVVGKYAHTNTDVLNKLQELGHLIGNHTYDHPDVTYYQSINGDIQNQILRTDAVIGNYIIGETTYFRAPYGKWSKEVADELNINFLASNNHIGPIFWDVGGVDCYYWLKGFSVDEAVEKYLLDINEKGHGIVVMHDDIADMDEVKYKNQTLELTKKLIPILLEKGYRFVRLDEIESIKKAAKELKKFNLKNIGGKTNSLLNNVVIVELGKGKIAIKAVNGLYLNSKIEGKEIIAANGETINDYTSFDIIPIISNQYVIRCANGNFWTINGKQGGEILTSEKYMKGADTFIIIPSEKPYANKVGFKTRVTLIKKRMLYIKSKIQQG